MPLAEDQDMIQTVAPDRPDQALSIRGYRDLRGSDPAQLFVRSLMPAISGRSNAGRKSAWEQLTTILAARGVGSRPHLASVLQESRKSANIHAGLEFNWRIPVEALIETAEEQRSSGEPRRKGLRYDGWRQARHRVSDVHDAQSSACRAAGGRRTLREMLQPIVSEGAGRADLSEF